MSLKKMKLVSQLGQCRGPYVFSSLSLTCLTSAQRPLTSFLIQGECLQSFPYELARFCFAPHLHFLLRFLLPPNHSRLLKARASFRLLEHTLPHLEQQFPPRRKPTIVQTKRTRCPNLYHRSNNGAHYLYRRAKEDTYGKGKG